MRRWAIDALLASAVGFALLFAYLTKAPTPCAEIKQEDMKSCIDATYEKIVKHRTDW